LAAPFGGLSVLALSLFALKDPNWSRLFIFLFGLMSAVGLAAYRLAARTYVTRRYRAGYYAKNVVIIGPLNSVRWMVDFFGKNVSGAAYKLFGFFNAGEERLTAPMGIEALGDVQDLGDVLIHRPIHEVVAIHPEAKSDWLKGVVRDCDYFGVTLRVVPEALLAEENRFLQIVYPSTALHLPAVVFAPRNYESEAQFFKRMVDIVVSLFMLILLSPLFLVIAIAIKLCTPSLPVFYPWRVVGYKGKHFTGYKFTTMVADADAKKADLMALNEMTGPVFKIKNDPRVTPLGRMLRKYSLNELPQFWSVLKGDMSLVGPRPAGPHELERYEMWHKRKLSVMPGITCLWQVRGRNAISDFDDWVKMDLEYIDNWSLWLDFKILIRTAWVVMVGTGS
jgi:exopolysaccharide biosynthesis polyprenyl glycosylphosphotransferase